MEIARNPAMLQELMRSQDRALSNLESIPGGYSALQRMYRDIQVRLTFFFIGWRVRLINAAILVFVNVQEPMFNAAQEQFGGNPFAALVNNAGAPAGSANPQAGQENRAPLPNPWSGSPSTQFVIHFFFWGANSYELIHRHLVLVQFARSTGSSTETRAPGGTRSPTSASTGMPGMAGMANSPGMQSLMQQMVENPQLMQSMMSAPYVQNMLQQMGSNPQLAEQMIVNNPLFASKLTRSFVNVSYLIFHLFSIWTHKGNPAMQEQMRTMLPNFMAQLNNPEVQNLVTNPQAMSAMLQIQQGMEQLRQVAPSFATTSVIFHFNLLFSFEFFLIETLSFQARPWLSSSDFESGLYTDIYSIGNNDDNPPNDDPASRFWRF